MGLDKELIKHLDRVDDVIDGVISKVDKLMLAIDIDLIIENPNEELAQISAMAYNEIKMVDEEVSKIGLDLAETVKNDVIKIQKTKDADINKDDVELKS